MEFTIQRNEIATAAGNAANGIPSNPLQPIYAGMHVEAVGGNAIVFTGSDGDVTFTGCDYGNVKQEGSVVVPGKLFADVLRSLPDGEVRIIYVTDHDQVIIKCGRANFTLRAQPGENYPQVPESPGSLGEVDGELFAAAIKGTVTSVGKDHAYPARTGILMEPDGDVLHFVATDTYRVAITEVPFKGTKATERVIIPAKAAENFARAVDGEVTLGWDEKLVSLKSGLASVTSRAIADSFPKWRQLLPKTPPDVEVPTEELASAVKRAQLAVYNDNTPVEFTFTAGRLYVEAGEEGSSSRDSVECTYSGDDFELLLGMSKLLDGLAACGKTVRFGWTKPLEPLHMESDSFRYTILPRRKGRT